MTRDELRELKPGDRVRWVSENPSETSDGEVVEKRNGYNRIRWADGAVEILGWRSGVDRERGRNIVKI